MKNEMNVNTDSRMARIESNIFTLGNICHSSHNVNLCNVSSNEIYASILSNGYDTSKHLMIAGVGVPNHSIGETIQGNNRLTALLQAVALGKNNDMSEGDVLEFITGGLGLPVVTVENCSLEELADLYNDNGIGKSITYGQVVKKARKYFQAGLGQFDVALKLEHNLNVLSPLAGERLEKLSTAKSHLNNNIIKISEYKEILGKVRRGIIQGIKDMATNDVTVDLCCLKYEGYSELGLPEYMNGITMPDFKKLAKAYELDCKQVDGEGYPLYSWIEKCDGVTNEFEKAFSEVKTKYLKKSKQVQPEQKVRPMNIGELKKALETAKSKHLQRILNIILKNDTDTLLSTVDTELLSNEKPALVVKPEIETKVQLEPVKSKGLKAAISAK